MQAGTVVLVLLCVIAALVLLAGWKCPGGSRRFCLRLMSVFTRRRPVHSAGLQMRRIGSAKGGLEMAPVDEDEILDPDAMPSADAADRPVRLPRLRPFGSWQKAGGVHARLHDGESSSELQASEDVDLEAGAPQDDGADDVGSAAAVPFEAPLDSPQGLRAAWALHLQLTQQPRMEHPTVEHVAAALAAVDGRSFTSLGIENFDEVAKARRWGYVQRKLLSQKGGKVQVRLDGMTVTLRVAVGPVTKSIELDCSGTPWLADLPFRLIAMTTALARDGRSVLQINYIYASVKAKAKGEMLFKVVSTITFQKEDIVWSEWTILPPGKGWREPVFSRTIFKAVPE
jgi:hypothetical protein